ncbi:MAG TPA: (Fe-S)-binding protein [Polyangia bacterium]|nr:(Fe-S)-binding protein [Polyangia bacterium]
MPDLETSLSYCTYCPKLCRHTCPVSNAETRETLVPQTKMATMRRLRLADGERSVADTEPLYGCTGCGACTEACLHKIAVGPALFRGRQEAEADGRGHPALAGFVKRFEAHSLAAGAELRALVPASRRPAEAQVAFMPGCEQPSLARPMLELCDRVGAEYVAVADGPHACGGYPLFAAGQFDAFRLHAERLAESLAGYARVVVHCPACAWAMRTQYREFGVPLAAAVEHSTEFLQGFAERLPIKQKAAPAFYHDPCYLGRHLGLYDPPRRLLGKAVDGLREFSRARGESECSGGGGLLPVTMPNTADAISEHRLEEVKEAGLARVVTACATCKRRLGRSGVTAIDLIELLADATQ